jgi:hypothetical protein
MTALHNKAYDSTSDKHCRAVSLNLKQVGKFEGLIQMRMHRSQVQSLKVSAIVKFWGPFSMPFRKGCGGSTAHFILCR